MENALNIVNGRVGITPVGPDMGTCFRRPSKQTIADQKEMQERPQGFYKTQTIPGAFPLPRDNYKHVDIPGASKPDDYFEECPWDPNIPFRRQAERMSDIKFYPKSRHAVGYEYDDCYNDRLAMKKIVRTKPMSFFVFGPSMIGPSPVATKIARKFGSVLIEPRRVMRNYFKKVHKTKKVEYDILEDGTVISSEATYVPAKLLGELILKKLKSYAVYKRGYVLTGVQYCKYSNPDNLSQVLNKVFSIRFAPDVVLYVEATIQDVESMYDWYSVYPMYPYEMVENFTLMGAKMLEQRKYNVFKDPRDDLWYKVGKSLSFDDCLVMEILQFKDVDVHKKTKDSTHMIPEIPEPVTGSVGRIYNAYEDMSLYFETALAIHRYVNHMDHHFVFKVKANTPAENQFHILMTRLNCLPVYKVPEVKYGPGVNEPFVDDEHYKESKNFVERVTKDEITGVMLSKYNQDLAELDEYDSDQDDFYLSTTTYFDTAKPTKESEDETDIAGGSSRASIVSEVTLAHHEEADPDDLTFAERYAYAQEQATLNDKIRYLRALNLKEAISSYNNYKEKVENLSDDEFCPKYGSKLVNYRATLSTWGRRCPVAFQYGMMIRGQSKYVARYHDKYYFMSSKKALKKFQVDPERYLYPLFPTTPCNVIVSGHPISGKTVIAEAIAAYYDAVVLDFASLRREAREFKQKAKLKLLEELTRNESQRYVNAEGVDIYLNDEFERHEDFLEWFTVIYRLIYFRAVVSPPDDMMTLPRKHGCVLAGKLKRKLSDIEEILPANIFKSFLKHVSFHKIDEEKFLIDKYTFFMNTIAQKVHEFPDVGIPPGETDMEKIRNARRLFWHHKIPYFGSLSILKKYLNDPVYLLRYCPRTLKPRRNPFELDPYHPVVSSFALEVWKLLDKTSKELTVEEEINILAQAIHEIEQQAKENDEPSYGGWVIDGVFMSTQMWQGLWERGLGNSFVVYTQDPDMDYFNTKLKTKRYVNRINRIQEISKTLEGLEMKQSPQVKEEEVLKKDCTFDAENIGIQLPDFGDFVSSQSEDELESSRLKSGQDYDKKTYDADTMRLKSAVYLRKSFARFRSSQERSYISGDSRASTEDKDATMSIRSSDSQDSLFNKASRLAMRYRASMAVMGLKRGIYFKDQSISRSLENIQFKTLDLDTPEFQVLKINLLKKKTKRAELAILPNNVYSKYIYKPTDFKYVVPVIEEMYNNLVPNWSKETETKVTQYFHDIRILMDELRNDLIQSGLIKSSNYYRRYVGKSDPLKYVDDFYDVIDGHGSVHRKKSPKTSTFFEDQQEEQTGAESTAETGTTKKTEKVDTFETNANVGTYEDQPIDVQDLWVENSKMSFTPKNDILQTKPIIRKKLNWCIVHLREGRTVRGPNKLTYLHREYPVCSKQCLKKFRRWPYKYTSIEHPYTHIAQMKISVLGLPGSGSNKVGQVLADYLGLKYLNFYDRFNERILLPGYYPIGPYYEQPKLMSRIHVPPNIMHTPRAMHYDYLMNSYLNHKRRMPLKYWVQFYMTDFKKSGFVYHQMPYSVHDFICMYAMDIMPDVIINIKRKRLSCRKQLENKVLEMWKRRIREINTTRLFMDKGTKTYWKALYLLNFWKYLRMLVDFFAELQNLSEKMKEEEIDNTGEEDLLDNTRFSIGDHRLESAPKAEEQPVLMSVLGSMRVKKIFYMPHKLRNTRRVLYSIKYIQRPVKNVFDGDYSTESTSDSEKDGSFDKKSETLSVKSRDNLDDFKERDVVDELAVVKTKDTLIEKLRKNVVVKTKSKAANLASTPKPGKNVIHAELEYRLEEAEYEPKMTESASHIRNQSLKRVRGTLTLGQKSRVQSMYKLTAEDKWLFRKTLTDVHFSRSKNKYLRMLEIDAKCIFKRLKAMLKKAMRFDSSYNETRMGAAMLYLADDKDPNKVQVVDLEGIGTVSDMQGEINKMYTDKTIDKRILESLTLKGIEAELISKFPILSELKTHRRFTPTDGDNLLNLIEKYKEISRFAPYVVKYMENKYPKPLLLGLVNSSINIDTFKETLAKTLKKEMAQIKKMRNYSKVFENAWLDVKPARRSMRSILTAMNNYRMPYGECVYDVNFKFVEEYIDNGTYYLSKFGRRCPVECFEKNTLWHSNLVPNDPIVVSHKRYVYFLSSQEARLKFVENPLKYISHNIYNINIPIRILIIGPENSRRMKVAQYFKEKYLLEIITVDMAMKFLFKNFQSCPMATAIYDYLRRGLGIPILMVYQVVEFYITTCGYATGYGWILVGIPGLLESLCMLKELRLLPHLLLVVDLKDKNAYYKSIDIKRQGKLKNGNIDPKIVRLLDKNVAEKNFDVWKSEELIVGTSNFCKQVVNYYISEGNYYPVYSALMLENAMEKLYNALKASHYFRYNSYDIAAPIGTFNRMDRMKFNLAGSDMRDNCILCWEYEGILTKSPNFAGIVDNIFEVNNFCYWLCDWHKNQMYIVPPEPTMNECRKPTVLLPTRVRKPIEEKELDFPYCVTCFKNDIDIVKAMNGERYVPGNRNCLFVCAGRFLSACREECLAKFYKRSHRYITAISSFDEILEREDFEESFMLCKEEEVPMRYWPPPMKYPDWFVYNIDVKIPKLGNIDDIIEYKRSSESSYSLSIYLETPSESLSEDSIVWSMHSVEDPDSPSVEIFMSDERKSVLSEEEAIEEEASAKFKYVDDYKELDKFSFERALEYINHLYNNFPDMTKYERDQCTAELDYEIGKFTITRSQEKILTETIARLRSRTRDLSREPTKTVEPEVEEERKIEPSSFIREMSDFTERRIKHVGFSEAEYFEDGVYLEEEESEMYEFSELSESEMFLSAINTEASEYTATDSEYLSEVDEIPDTEENSTIAESKSYFDKYQTEVYSHYGEGIPQPIKHYGEGYYGEDMKIIKTTFYIEPEESFEEFFPEEGACLYKFTSGMSLEVAPQEIPEIKPPYIPFDEKYRVNISIPPHKNKIEKFQLNIFAQDQNYVKYITQTDPDEEPALCPDLFNTIEQVKHFRDVYNEDKYNKMNLPYLAETLSDILIPDHSDKMAKKDLYRKLVDLGKFVKVNVNRDEFPRFMTYERKTQTFFNTRCCPFTKHSALANYFLDPRLANLCPLCAFNSNSSKTKYDTALTITPFCCFMEFEIVNNLNEKIDNYYEEADDLASFYSSTRFGSESVLDEDFEEMMYDDQEIIVLEPEEVEETSEKVDQVEEIEGYFSEELEEEEEAEEEEEEMRITPSTKKLYEPTTYDEKLSFGYPLHYTFYDEEKEEEFPRDPIPEPYGHSLARIKSPTLPFTTYRADLIDVKGKLDECSSESFKIVKKTRKSKQVEEEEDRFDSFDRPERRVTIMDDRNSVHYFYSDHGDAQVIRPPELDQLLEDDDDSSFELGSEREKSHHNLWQFLDTLGVDREIYGDDHGRAKTLYKIKMMLDRFIFNRTMLDMVQDPFDAKETVASQFFDSNNDLIDFNIIPNWLDIYHEQSHMLPDAIELLAMLKDEISSSYIIEILRNWVKSYAFGSYNLHYFFEVLKATKCRKFEYNMIGYKYSDDTKKNNSIWDTILTLERAKMPLDRIATNAATDALHKSRFIKEKVLSIKKRLLVKMIREKIKELKSKWTQRLISHNKALKKRQDYLKLATTDENKEEAYKSIYGERVKRKRKKTTVPKYTDNTRAAVLRRMKKPKDKKESIFEKDLREFLTTLAFNLPPGEPSPEMDIQEKILDLYMKRHPNFYWMDTQEFPSKVTDVFYSTGEPDEVPHPFKLLF